MATDEAIPFCAIQLVSPARVEIACFGRSACATKKLVIANEVKQSPTDQLGIASPQENAARNDVSNVLSGSPCHGLTRNDMIVRILVSVY